MPPELSAEENATLASATESPQPDTAAPDQSAKLPTALEEEGEPAQEETPGATAYNAYFDAVGGRSYDGHALQTWDGLNHHPLIRNAWEAAAQAVLARHGSSGSKA